MEKLNTSALDSIISPLPKTHAWADTLNTTTANTENISSCCAGADSFNGFARTSRVRHDPLALIGRHITRPVAFRVNTDDNKFIECESHLRMRLVCLTQACSVVRSTRNVFANEMLSRTSGTPNILVRAAKTDVQTIT